MSVDIGQFWHEVNAIKDSGFKGVNYRLEATLHVRTTDVKVTYVIESDLERNYVKHHADVRMLTIAVSPGDYAKYVIPNQTVLELTLRKVPLGENSTLENGSADPIVFRYRAIPVDPKSDHIEANSIVANRTEVANNATIKEVTLQLVDPSVERLRMVAVGGIYRDVAPATVIRAVLGHTSAKYTKDGETGPLGVDIAENAAKELKDHVVIKHGTPLFRFPIICHISSDGVFTAGFNFYYQNRIWYVYPTHDVTRFAKASTTLTVMRIPNNRMPSPDRSFRASSSQVVIIATGDVSHADTSEQEQLNIGNGVRFGDANKAFEGYLGGDNNKAVANRTENMNEFVFEQRDDGLNMVMATEQRFTSNTRLEMCKLAPRNGALIQLVWENSDDSFIHPGMPCKYMYIEDDNVHEMEGCVVGIQSHSASSTPGIINQRFVNRSAVTLFVKRAIPVGEEK